MTFRIIPVSKGAQPREQWLINKSHPSAVGLILGVAAYPLAVDPVQRIALLSGSFTLIVRAHRPYGPVQVSQGNSSALLWTAAPVGLPSSTSLSILQIFNFVGDTPPTASTSLGGMFSGTSSGGFRLFWVNIGNGTTAVIRGGFRNAAGSDIFFGGGTTAVQGTPYIVVLTQDPVANRQALFVNGVLDATEGTDATNFSHLPRALSQANFGLGNHIGIMLAWNRALSSHEGIELSKNPWALFGYQRRRLYFFSPLVPASSIPPALLMPFPMSHNIVR